MGMTDLRQRRVIAGLPPLPDGTISAEDRAAIAGVPISIAAETPAAAEISVTISGTTATLFINGYSSASHTAYYLDTGESVWVSAGSLIGDGTIEITGLTDGISYQFIVYSVIGGVVYTSEIVSATVPTTVINSFDSQLFSDADIFLSTFGISIVYHPYSGGKRTIVGIVDHDQVAAIAGFTGANTQPGRITVKNSSTDGISSVEVNTGRDKIAYPVRQGQSPQERRIARILSMDYGMMTLEMG
jgi:hypothetical protein